jgi:hypothetical protein
MIFATYMAWQKNKWYWLLVAICFSVLIQLHYLTLLMAGGAGLIWLWQLRETVRLPSVTKRWHELRTLVIVTLISAVIFGASLTPLLLFDLKHDWLNVKAFQALFTTEEILSEKSGDSPIRKIAEIAKGTHGRSINLLFETSFGQHLWLNTIMLVIVIGILIKIMKSPSPHRPGYVVVLTYLLVTIIGTAAYEHSIFDHYIIFALPAAYLALGMVLAWLSRSWGGKLVVVVWLAAYLLVNFPRMPLKQNGSNIYYFKNVADSVQSRLKPGEPYSLVLLAPSGDLYGQNYRYFLSTGPSPALPPERAGEATTLVIINEEHLKGVPSLPIYEIVTFPEKRPSEVYTIPDGPQIWIFRKPAAS